MSKVTTINTLVVKPACLEEYIAAQRAFASAFSAAHNGLIGGRLYRALQGSKVVLISQFESKEAQETAMRSPELAAQIARLRELVASSSPDLFEEAYTYGNFK